MTDSDGKSRLHVGQSHIEDAIKTKPELARYATMLKELDTDRDGSLNISEVCAALDRIVKSEKQNRLLKWFAAITTGLLLLSIAATAGLTYAIVDLAKDMKSMDGILVSKDSDKAMVTGSAVISVVDDPDSYPELLQAPSSSRRRQLLSSIFQSTDDDNVCIKYYGRMEKFQVDNLCANYESNVATYILKLVSSTCRTYDGTGEKLGEDCPTYSFEVRVKESMCQLLNPNYDTTKLCQNPVQDINHPDKLFEEHDIIVATPLEPLPEESIPTKQRNVTLQEDYKFYKLRVVLKASCGSINDEAPAFQDWYLSAGLTREIDCPVTILPSSTSAPEYSSKAPVVPASNAPGPASNTTSDNAAVGTLASPEFLRRRLLESVGAVPRVRFFVGHDNLQLDCSTGACYLPQN